MIKKLLNVLYRVSDLEKTVSFYKEVLGLKEVERLRSPRDGYCISRNIEAKPEFAFLLRRRCQRNSRCDA